MYNSVKKTFKGQGGNHIKVNSDSGKNFQPKKTSNANPLSSPSACRMSRTDQAERIIEIRSEPQNLINTNKKRLRSPSIPSSVNKTITTTTAAMPSSFSTINLQNYRDLKGLLNLAHKCSFRSRSSQQNRFLAPVDASMPRSLSVNYLYQKRQGGYFFFILK